MAKGTEPGGGIAMPVQVTDFGRDSAGRPAHLYTLRNSHGMVVRISDWGGLVTGIEVPDRRGIFANVALGFANLADYETRNLRYYFGSPIGRYANRISGSRFIIDGQVIQLIANEGPNTLHSGPAKDGYNLRPWEAESFDAGPTSGVKLRLLSTAGDQGFPGALAVTLIYTLGEDNALRIDYRAKTDRATAVNLTNHSYFNLAGVGNGTILEHRIEVFADRVAELDSHKLPTGHLLPVSGSYDLRHPTTIADGIRADPKLTAAGGYDDAFVLASVARSLPTLAARASDPLSGRVMEVLTTEPSLQFYTGNSMTGIDYSPDGAAYVRHAGLALETQHLPDSVNHRAFPSTVLRPSEIFRSSTIYRFSVSAMAQLHQTR